MGRGPAAASAEIKLIRESTLWFRHRPPPWGGVSLREACAHATMGPLASEYTNELAAEAIGLLNRCYLTDDAPLPPGFPCPADVRGLARRKPAWRLPGVYFMAYNELTRRTCGHVESDGIHVGQVVLPMLRSLLAAVGR